MLLEDFATPGNQINLTAAAQQCALCAMVYENEADNIRALVQPEGELLFLQPSLGTWLPGIAAIRSGASRYFVISEGTVSFTQALVQGSPLNGLASDREDPLTPGPSFGIFYNWVYENLRGLLAPILPFADPAAKFYFSGHSMGGAIAMIAGFQFSHHVDATRCQVMTFGQPKAGGSVGEWPYPTPAVYYRVNSSGDLVPGYPSGYVQWFLNKLTLRAFSSLFSDLWRHYGIEIVLTQGGTDDPNAPWPVPPPRGWRLNQRDQHGLNNYLARILLRAQFVEPD